MATSTSSPNNAEDTIFLQICSYLKGDNKERDLQEAAAITKQIHSFAADLIQSAEKTENKTAKKSFKENAFSNRLELDFKELLVTEDIKNKGYQVSSEIFWDDDERQVCIVTVKAKDKKVLDKR